jgi:hypothetical protein
MCDCKRPLVEETAFICRRDASLPTATCTSSRSPSSPFPDSIEIYVKNGETAQIGRLLALPVHIKPDEEGAMAMRYEITVALSIRV